jgi:hypothetical protein
MRDSTFLLFDFLLFPKDSSLPSHLIFTLCNHLHQSQRFRLIDLAPLQIEHHSFIALFSSFPEDIRVGFAHFDILTIGSLHLLGG